MVPPAFSEADNFLQPSPGIVTHFSVGGIITGAGIGLGDVAHPLINDINNIKIIRFIIYLP